MTRSQNIAGLLLIVSGMLLAGCDAPVRIGIDQARAAGISVSAVPRLGQQAMPRLAPY